MAWGPGAYSPQDWNTIAGKNETMVQPCRSILPVGAMVLLLAAGPVLALTGLEIHGYLRAGAGTAAGGDGRQACFFLPGAGAKYRLGNECETYGELAASYGRQPAGGRPGWRYLVMLNARGEGEPGLGNVQEAARHVGRPNQNWLDLEMPAGGILAGAHLWLGRRFYQRQDVHINDFFYWDNSGPGLGIEDVSFGPYKFAYAFRRDDKGEGPTATDPRRVLSHDFRLYGRKDRGGGEFTLGFDYKHAEGGGAGRGLDGYWLNARHVLDRGERGFNKLALQYGRGAGAGLNGHPVNATDGTARTWRLVEQLLFQPGPALSGMFTLIYQDGRDSAGARSRWFSMGARPILHLDGHWNVAAEAGHDRVWSDGAAERLGKLTVALQYSAGRGFFARPVGRLFVTHARWNRAAQGAAAAGSPLSASGVFGSRTRGTTYGLQLETWF